MGITRRSFVQSAGAVITSGAGTPKLICNPFGEKLPASPFHIIAYFPGSLESAKKDKPIVQWTCPKGMSVSFARGFGGEARGFAHANPKRSAACPIYKLPAGSSKRALGILIGCIVITPSGVFTFSLTASTFAYRDSMTVWPPDPVDVTLLGVGYTLPGLRSGSRC